MIRILLFLAASAAAQSEWAWRAPLPQGHSLYGAAWTGSRFVAVGDHGTVAVSSDGKAWNASWSGTASRLSSVTYALPHAGSAPGLILAVGDSGTILASEDGAGWAGIESGTRMGLLGVAYGSGTFVAVGEGGTILASPDGSVWTRRESGIAHALQGIAWAGTLFVAVGGNSILTSPDGASWTVREAATQASLRGVGWGNGRIAVVGDDATILTSGDGAAWTLRHAGVWQLRGVAWAEDRFVAAGKYGHAWVSRDGTAWDSVYVGMEEDFFAVAWGPGAGSAGAAVMVGNAGAIASSPPAPVSREFRNWTAGNSGSHGALRSIATDESGWHVAVGDDGLILSGTGTAYDARSDGTINGFRSVVRAGPRWIAAGWLGISRSPDGIAWSADSGRGYDPRYDFHSLAWIDSGSGGSGLIIAVGRGGIIQTSPDGASWTMRDSGKAEELRSVTASPAGFRAGGRRLVAAGKGPILVSADGISWTESFPASPGALSIVAAGEAGFLAAGEGGTILTSPDGLVWTARESGVRANLSGAVWTGRQWIVTGDAGVALRSSDGAAWSASFLGGADLYSVARDRSLAASPYQQLLIAGSGGTVLSAREDAPARISAVPPRVASPAWRRTAEGLSVLLPLTWRNRELRLALYDPKGVLIAETNGRFGARALLPLPARARGKCFAEILAGGERLAGIASLSL